MTYPDALFHYAWAPAEVPCSDPSEPNTVVLMLTVTNSTGKDMGCDQIGFTLTQGPDGAHLTNDVAAVNTAVATGTTWSFAPIDGAPAGPGASPVVKRSFVATPPDSDPIFHNDTSIALLLNDVHVNTVPGGVDVDILETTADGTTRQKTLTIAKRPSTLGITQFTAAPVQVRPGQASLLTWAVAGSTKRTLTIGNGPTTPVDAHGTQPVSPQITTRCTLSAEGGGNTTTADVWITVPEVRVLDFKAVPGTVAQGDTTTLSWVTIGASSAVITPGNHELDDPGAGHIDVPVPTTTPFSLEAASPDRSASQTKTVTVPPVSMGPFSASAPVIAPGNSTTLTWAVKWASACTIDQGVGSVDRLGGTKPVSPAATTTYTLSAAGFEPQQAAVTIGVGAAITSFGCTADPAKPNEVVVAWDTTVESPGTVTMVVSQGREVHPAVGVPPFGTRPFPTNGGLLSVVLHVDGPTTHAVATLVVPRPLISAGAQFTALQLTCPPGINAVGATAQVKWTAVGTVTGTVDNALGQSLDIDGPTGALPFALGVRAPQLPLWQGDLQIGAGPLIHFEVA